MGGAETGRMAPDFGRRKLVRDDGFSLDGLSDMPGSGSCTGSGPQRIQSRRLRSIPAAAADSGWSVSDTSTQAQTRLSFVRHAMKERASDVRPEHSEPVSSVMAPM